MVISDVRDGKVYRLPPESAYITKLNCNNQIHETQRRKKVTQRDYMHRIFSQCKILASIPTM